MPTTEQDLALSDYQALAALRYQIRRFLHFSEAAAKAEGLEPQQHQMLLSIRASEREGGPTIGDLAADLIIHHHSAVGLVDRLADRGLVERIRGGEDRRQVRVRLTPEAEARLSRLSTQHRAELFTSGPSLLSVLGEVLRSSVYKEKDVSEK